MITAAMQAVVIKHRSLFISHGLYFGAACRRVGVAKFNVQTFSAIRA
jgi:hypothetical protein